MTIAMKPYMTIFEVDKIEFPSKIGSFSYNIDKEKNTFVVSKEDLWEDFATGNQTIELPIINSPFSDEEVFVTKNELLSNELLYKFEDCTDVTASVIEEYILTIISDAKDGSDDPSNVQVETNQINCTLQNSKFYDLYTLIELKLSFDNTKLTKYYVVNVYDYEYNYENKQFCDETIRKHNNNSLDKISLLITSVDGSITSEKIKSKKVFGHCISTDINPAFDTISLISFERYGILNKSKIYNSVKEFSIRNGYRNYNSIDCYDFEINFECSSLREISIPYQDGVTGLIDDDKNIYAGFVPLFSYCGYYITDEITDGSEIDVDKLLLEYYGFNMIGFDSEEDISRIDLGRLSASVLSSVQNGDFCTEEELHFSNEVGSFCNDIYGVTIAAYMAMFTLYLYQQVCVYESNIDFENLHEEFETFIDCDINIPRKTIN